MREPNPNIRIYIGALIMVVLQLFVGPIISINAIVPNFLLGYTIVCIVARPDKMHLGFAFLMGLIYDLVCNGPVGAMAFVMLIFAFIIMKVLQRIENINLAVSLLVIFISVFFIEIFYGAFQVSLTVNVSFLDIIAYRVLPCTIYDSILAFIMFAVMIRIIAPPVTTKADSINQNITNSR